MAHLVYQAAISNRSGIEDPSVASYQLTAFVLMYLARLVLEQEPSGKQAVVDPLPLITDAKKNMQLRTTMNDIMKMIVIDLNFYIREQKEADEFWDYRRAFKRKADVTALGNEVVKSYQKEVARDSKRGITL